ncbi:MAG: hypothetical protein JSV48_23470 [Bradyrhizobium sp.]|nr:MAG: hypothetical protein JSV48_23470 [Bradyrhizobium sp.]
MTWEISSITAVVSATAAWAALFLSIVNMRTSRRALKLSERQEERRKPSLAAHLHEGFTSFSSAQNERIYGVLLSVMNTSDNNNSIASASLHLTYSRLDGGPFKMEVGTRAELPPLFEPAQSPLSVPMRIDAHQVISGWCFFSFDGAVLRDAEVERTLVVLRDTHGNEISIEPIILRDFSYEDLAQKTKEDLSKAQPKTSADRG